MDTEEVKDSAITGDRVGESVAGDPVYCLKEVLRMGTSGVSLLIITDLKKLSRDFLDSYSNIFGWHFRDSERSLLSSKISNPKYEFSYFDRIHSHFGFDQLEFVLEGLRNGTRSRVISTWDQTLDMRTKEIIPCLTLLQFSLDDSLPRKLDLSVVFRSRDIVRRMVPNWNALDILQRQCADALHCEQGVLIDYSLKWFYTEADYSRLFPIL